MPTSYDVVIIGAGTGGYVAAIRCAQLGKKVAVVEKQKALGGTCLIWGCIPTKALLEHAHALKVIRDAKEWGVVLPAATPAIDMNQVQSRKDRIVTGLTRGVEFLFKKNRIDWIKGTAHLAGKGKVEIVEGETQTLEAKEIVVATGSYARSVPGIEIDHKRIITSDDAIALKDVPKTLVIMGSGAVGVEFASMYARFGSKVTIIEVLPRVVPIEDEDVSRELAASFKRQGIAIYPDTRVERLTRAEGGAELIARSTGDKTETFRAEKVLMAVGRRPLTEGMGLEALGVATDRGYVKVDAMMRTTAPGVYAIGDVLPTPALAHLASQEGVVAVEHMAGKSPQPINYDQVPGCTYCSPEIGSVGLTEAKARERGYDVVVGKFPFSAVGKARILNQASGFAKIVAEKKYDEVLGVHIIGPSATELIAEACAAMKLEATSEELVNTIHAHPTLSEVMHEASEAVLGHAIHI